MSNENKRRRTALVTGASGGLGREFARLLANDGFNLVLAARSEDKLNEEKANLEKMGVRVTIISVDLSLTDGPRILCEALQRDGIMVDVLVNNAGFGAYGAFAESREDEQLEMLQLNVTSLTHLTRLLLPGMVQRKWGRVLNVASMAAFQPGPYMAVYYASKAYVLSFSQALGNELRDTGVRVTCLCPGPTRTNFEVRAGMENSRVFQGNIMDAATVAETGYEGMVKGRDVVVLGLRSRFWAKAAGLVPRGLVVRMAGRAQDRV